MDFKQQNLTDFTALLASSSPTPGGGGASAVVGALGIALGNMVGELTVGKKKYAEAEPQLRLLMARAQELRKAFLVDVEKDAEAFEPLSRAYRIPKDDPNRDEVMERCLRDAAAAPLKIFDRCCEAIALLRDFGELGSPMVLSDAATGVVFCRSAMYGAAVNVKVNTKRMRNRAYAEELNAHVDQELARWSSVADAVFEDIDRRYS